MENLTQAIAFARIQEIPTPEKKRLIDLYGSPQTLFESMEKRSFLRTEDEKIFQLIRNKWDQKFAEDQLRKLKKLNGFAVVYKEPGYPKFLSEITDPPIVLMGLGTLPQNDEKFLSVVGPRKASAYGLRIAKMLTLDLAFEGLTIVSGLARGVDAVAHAAALQAKGKTIAILGCGVDQTYPPEHAKLKSDILSQGGAILSEFSLGEGAQAWHFPLRNRIISGLSRGLLVIEAGEKSGARITARHALEQYREVYAVPGPIDSPLSMYTNQLISEGAKLVASSDQILEDYFPEHRGKSKKEETKKAVELSQEAKRLLDCLALDEPIGVDDLVTQGEMPVASVLQSLLELEIKGIVARKADARYVRLQ